jgi:hypothetical protein
LFDDNDGKNRKIGANDAASDGLTFALAGSTGAVTGVAFGEEETDTSGMEDTLKKLERELETGQTFFIGKPCLSFPPVTLKT